MFSLTCNLTKNGFEFLPIEISLKKSTWIFRPSKLHRKTCNVRKKYKYNVDVLTIKITSRKVRWNNVDFSTSEIAPKKVRVDDVDFSISEITSKKYVEMT